MTRYTTYPDIFPPKTRVVVAVGKGEGSDQEWNGHPHALKNLMASHRMMIARAMAPAITAVPAGNL